MSGHPGICPICKRVYEKATWVYSNGRLICWRCYKKGDQQQRRQPLDLAHQHKLVGWDGEDR